VGSCHIKPKCPRGASPRRPRVRMCLRKGCGQKYLPRRCNQRYCQDPECLRQLRRWQAAKRQAKRRQHETVKAQHAEAERVRRQQTARSPQTPNPPKVAAARGHAAKSFFQLFCATGQDAMSRPPSRVASQRASAAGPVARRFAGSRIANASGYAVELSKAARPASASTLPPARGGPNSNSTPPTRRHRGRRPRDRATRSRRSAVCCRGFQAP
jgi:hypothetical protein